MGKSLRGVLLLGFCGFYLCLAGDLSAVELCAAAVCGAAGMAMSIALGRVARRKIQLSFPMKIVLRPVRDLVPEWLAVGHALLTAISSVTPRDMGTFVVQPFEADGIDALSAGRRALVVIGLSLAPGSVVIRGEREGALLLHALPDRTPSRDATWPA